MFNKAIYLVFIPTNYLQVAEHLNNLISMKLSPFYKVFAEEASSWEEKLNRLHEIFDVCTFVMDTLY